jgi:hypothetical protein
VTPHSDQQIKINKETSNLNCTIEQMDLSNIYRIFHPMAAEYTFFSGAHGTFYKRDHILEHEATLHKQKKLK